MKKILIILLFAVGIATLNANSIKHIAEDRNSIKSLYGDEFSKFTPGQQQYILNNKEIMRRITQQVLSRIARVNLPKDLNVNSDNTVEFYLHPKGTMTNFKVIKTSGYDILDATSEQVILNAYNKYPRPKEITLIRYNIFYKLKR
ncbi:MAG: energy transducer TonB [Sulfurimonas sp.]|uniref:energy transducer TonB family protein n=1 Tax=Sulfurimonas sp. TaxID=2022749 RepID=UPI0025D70B53|nr:energy transducer TonB [Sulfurimonas sp.]MCK9490723.1 energy transducer TonB [Sulfurimonas sp.]